MLRPSRLSQKQPPRRRCAGWQVAAWGLLLLLAGCAQPSGSGPTVWVRQASVSRPLPKAGGIVAEVTLPHNTTNAPRIVDDAQLLLTGAQLYQINCAPCHRANGEGNLGRFPRLNRSPLVTGQAPEPLIRTVLYGRREMPGFIPILDDHELAAVLSYVRQAWDNQADRVTPDQIQAIRTAEGEE